MMFQPGACSSSIRFRPTKPVDPVTNAVFAKRLSSADLSDYDCSPAIKWPPGTPSVASDRRRSEEHTSELQSLMRISYAVFCLKKQTFQHQPLNRHSYRSLDFNKTHNTTQPRQHASNH